MVSLTFALISDVCYGVWLSFSQVNNNKGIAFFHVSGLAVICPDYVIL